MAETSWTFAVTDADFETQVIKKSHETPVLVDFWAPWCGPCLQLAPLLEAEITRRQGDVLLAKVNTDEQPRLASYYGIQGLPTVLAFKNGKPVDEFVGMLPERDITRFFDRIGPTEADKQAQAAGGLEKTDPTMAEGAYRAALEKDPDQESAVLGLCRLLIDQGRDAEAVEVLDRVGPGSEQAEEFERLSALLFLRRAAKGLPDEQALRSRVAANPKDAPARYELGVLLAVETRYADALEMLLAAGERDAKLAGSKVKETMVKVFHLIGARSPLADDYRARLTTLLY